MFSRAQGDATKFHHIRIVLEKTVRRSAGGAPRAAADGLDTRGLPGVIERRLEIAVRLQERDPELDALATFRVIAARVAVDS